MKRMLFNATQAEELRVAIVDGQKLLDLDIESAAKEQRKSNIYKGIITRVEPSLEAAFVNYGTDRHGFLPFKEISRSYFQPGVEASKARIQDAIKEGQEVVIQVDKDERGNKGAALTTYVSLAGRYLVLMPNNPRGGGVSRRVEGDERTELREAMSQLDVPGGMSLIARTAAIGRAAEELQWDMNYLLQLWQAIDNAANSAPGPFLIYQEGSLVIRAIRDYFQPDIGEILIDTPDVFAQAQQFMSHVMPNTVNRVKLYNDDVPLFSRFQIEHQIESAFARQVNLPSGGAIVIDHTEALVSVDVNSGRATRGQDIEETALKTNLEAADEVGRQLRLRDLGGLIVIDFIDMESQRNQREVENRLRDALHHDRARVQMGKISRFGLMELSRQRLRPSLGETSHIPCPRCSGTGHIRSTESAALHILRILEEEAMKDNTAAIHTQVPVDVATFLLNEKRSDIAALELRHRVNLLLLPNIHMVTPQHIIERIRHDELNQEDRNEVSYQMAVKPEETSLLPGRQKDEPVRPRQEAMVKGITPAQPAPTVPEKRNANVQPAAESGFLSRILAFFRGGSEPETASKPTEKREEKSSGERGRGNQNRGRRGRGRNDNRGDKPREESRADNKAREESRGDARPDAKEGEGRQEGRGRRGRGRQDEARKNGDSATGEESSSPRSGRRERKAQADAHAVTAAVKESLSETTTKESAETSETESNGSSSRRRGRRGGRGRRRNSDESNSTEANVETGAASEVSSVEDAVQRPAEAAQAAAPAIATEAASSVAESSPTQPAPEAAGTPAEVTETPAADKPEGKKPTRRHPPLGRIDQPAEVLTTPEETLAPDSAPAAEPAAAPTETDETPVVAEAVEPASEEKALEITEAPVVAAAPEQKSEPLVETAPAPQAPELNPEAIQKALDKQGLELIETVAAAQPAPVAEEAPAPRKPRRRRQSAPVSDEPMVMIETHKSE